MLLKVGSMLLLGCNGHFYGSGELGTYVCMTYPNFHDIFPCNATDLGLNFCQAITNSNFFIIMSNYISACMFMHNI